MALGHDDRIAPSNSDVVPMPKDASANPAATQKTACN